MTSRAINDTTRRAKLASAEFKYYKNLFHLQSLFWDIPDMNFVEAIEYGLSNLISSV